MKRLQTSALIIGLACAFAAPCSGDTSTTSDGSTLVGAIDGVADGKLVIITEIAGRLTIDLSKVTGISTARQMNVEIDSGDKLVGTVDTTAEPGQALVRSQLSEVPV